MPEQVEQWICIKFCIWLEHSSANTIQTIQKAVASDNWWLAASWWQCAHSYIMSPAEVFGKKSNYPGNSAPLQPRCAALWLLTSPKTEIIFEKEEIRPSMRFRTMWQGSSWRLGKLCEVPRCLLWRGLRHHCPMDNVSCIFFNKCLYFSYYMAGHLLDRPHIWCRYMCIYTHI